MSRRHREKDSVPLAKAELRAHAHAERHRLKGKLHALVSSIGRTLDPDECDEPAVEWRPTHHLEHHRAGERATRRMRLRHWKMKEWKRRSNERRARARIEMQRTKSV
jgi:hypothetical protein